MAKEDFEKFPVWTWDDENVGYLPISERNPSPENYWGLFIKASFITPDQHQFDGYLIGDNHFYAFGLFVGKEEVIFNINLSIDIEHQLKKLFDLLKCNPFPLQYKSEVALEDGTQISGTFQLKNGELFCVSQGIQ